MIGCTGPQTPHVFQREDADRESIEAPELASPLRMNTRYRFDDTDCNIEENECHQEEVNRLSPPPLRGCRSAVENMPYMVTQRHWSTVVNETRKKDTTAVVNCAVHPYGLHAMQQLISGLHKFESEIFGSLQGLYKQLAQGQHPHTLFITCSDSRIDPLLLTQSKPGELFILRNAGNIIPPYGSGAWGEAATIEFAVGGLGVENIIVCGHSLCGAMKGLLEPPPDFPALTAWLRHAEATRRIVADLYRDRNAADQLNVAIQENVLLQIEHLRTHPVVASALVAGKLRIYGWVYKLETGEVFNYNPQAQQFEKVTRDYSPVATVPYASSI